MRRPPLALVPALSLAVLLAGCSATPSAQPSTSPSPAISPTAAATASASPSPSPSPTAAVGPAVRIPGTITGMHVAGVQDGAWPDGNVPFRSLRLWDAGTAWSQVESVKGQYNWTLLDNSVKNAESHKVKDILLVLGSTPTWNAKRIKPGDYPVPGAASAPKDVAAWDAFVRAVVTRYKGRITSYQVWNEASLAMFWNGSPEQMADLTKRAADIIHSVDPKATVVAASTTVRLPGAFDRFFTRYLAALAAVDWPIDVFAAHMYPASKGTTDERAAFIGQVTDALAAASAPDLPVWDTELNYGLAGPGPANPHLAITGATARDWVVQTAFDSLALGIARTYWYIWTPKPYPLLGMQLTNDSGAVQGLRIVDQWAVGATTTGCTDDGSVTVCPLDRDGAPSIVQVCSPSNECIPITGPIVLTETPVRLTP
ncbi:MAG: hypothetical protein NTX29_07710 [Actinobacteria bacterium]|nr:hypothetical protein [Actinomycetota bacterium]